VAEASSADRNPEQGTPAMSTQEQDLDPTSPEDESTREVPAETTEAEAGTATETAPRKLDLDVQITESGPCKKHIKVSISPEDVQWKFDDSLGNLRKEAAVPGFRVGRAPKKLVERRFRKEVAGQVKSQLVVQSLEQIEKEHKLLPIAQPDFDIDAIEVPEEGPMIFEMEIEVQPDFELPDYRDIVVQRPVKTLTEADVDSELRSFLERYAQIVPKLEGGAELGDFIITDLAFEYEGVQLNQFKDMQIRVQPDLRFQDGYVPDFDKVLLGARPGDYRSTPAQIGSGCPDPALRGKTITMHFQIHDLKRIRMPEVTSDFLRGLGFDTLNELRDALRSHVERRREFQQRSAVRRAILDELQARVAFDLPSDLVSRQEKSTLNRLVLDLRQSGLSDSAIRAREAELRANAHETTLRFLKDFFLISKIAESAQLKVEDDDIDQEIETIASRLDESPRRVRARYEKEGQIEDLASQILERKVIDHILQFAKYEEVPMVEERAVETLDRTASPVVPETQDQGEGASEGDAPARD
jgi:trigger factor